MKEVDATKINCLKDVRVKCAGKGCMGWLQKSPEEPDSGQCLYLCVGSGVMKVLHIWATLSTQQRSPIIRGG
jgi:hypothetical protein